MRFFEYKYKFFKQKHNITVNGITYDYSQFEGKYQLNYEYLLNEIKNCNIITTKHNMT